MMNNDFMLSPQSFMKNNVAPDYTARNRENAKSFYKSSSDSNTVENKASFESFMEDLKARNAQNNRSSSKSDDTQNSNAEQTKDLASEHADKVAFLTRLAKTQNTQEIVDPSETDVSDEDLSNIELKMAQVLEALEKIKLELSKDAPKDTTATDDTLDITKIDDSSDASNIKILALLVNINEDAKPLLDDTSVNGQTDPMKVLTQVIDKLRSMIADGKESLITINKTPEQLASLQKIVEDILKGEIDKKNDEMLQKLAAQWSSLTLIPEQPKQKTPEVLLEKQTLATGKTEPLETAPQEQVQKSDAQKRYDDRYIVGADAKDTQNNSDISLERGHNEKLKSAPLNVTPHSEKTAQIPQNTKAMGDQFLQALNDSVLAPPIMTAQGDLLYTNNSGAIIATSQSPTQAAMTNVSTQAPHATQPHPATQTVMATISKAVKTGETSQIKIQLDPPELGRVEVKMSIDKNNITKVVLTSEKAETHTMLQRDAHILERVLQDTGLYNDSGISFELANDFNQNTPSGEERNQFSQKGSKAQDDDFIQTTMDWEVDPRTGVMHYNILA